MVNLKPKVQASGIVDLALLGVAKSVTEKALTPVIGNGTVQSGGIKLLGGGLLNSFVGGKIGNIVGGGLFVDGMEDVITHLMGKMGKGGDGAAEDAW